MIKECIICYEPILYNKSNVIKNKVLYIKIVIVNIIIIINV